MKEFIFYIKYDIQQLIKRNATKYFYILLFIIIILYTIYTYFTQSKYFENISEMSATWYVFLENSGSIVRGFYFSFISILATLPFGLQYYYEKSSKYREYLISKGCFMIKNIRKHRAIIFLYVFYIVYIFAKSILFYKFHIGPRDYLNNFKGGNYYIIELLPIYLTGLFYCLETIIYITIIGLNIELILLLVNIRELLYTP